MSTGDLKTEFLDAGCFPHQAEFAAKFLAPNSEQKHLLIGLPGLGKGFMGSAIVGYAATHGAARRILVLAPTALAYQWADMLRRTSPNASCTIVDRRRLRELEASCEDAIWENTGVVVMEIDFAKRPEVADLLAKTPWNIVVVDEAHHLNPHTQRYELVARLLENSPNTRALFLHTLAQVADRDVSANPLFRDIASTVWSRETVRDRDGTPLLPEVHIEWIRHQRRDDERRLLSHLQAALQAAHIHDARSNFEATMLLQSASSSLFALEQRLNRMRQLRNELAHGISRLAPESEEDDLQSDERQQPPNEQSLAQSSFIDQTDELLKMLDEVDTDSKLESLLALLGRIGLSSSGDRRACVFTSYVDTATYLESALSEHHPNVAAITGALPLAEREQAVAHFSETGGILISTSVMASRFPEVAAVIFYDLPLNPALLDDRIGQFIRVGRRDPVHVFAFADESDSLGIERLQRKAIEIKQALGSDEVQKFLFSDEVGGP